MNLRNVCLAVAVVAAGSGCASHPPPAALSSQDVILDVYLPAEQWKPTTNEAAEAKAALLAYLASDELPAGDSPQSFTAVYRTLIAARMVGMK